MHVYVRVLSKKFVQYIYKNFILQIFRYINVVPFKYSPLDTVRFSHLRFHCWKNPWNSSSLKPFSSDVVSLLIVITSPRCRPRSTNLHLGNKKKSQGAKSGK